MIIFLIDLLIFINLFFYLHKLLDKAEYDDKLVRQIIDTIKVMSESQIIICFKNGLEYEQEMEVTVKPRNKTA